MAPLDSLEYISNDPSPASDYGDLSPFQVGEHLFARDASTDAVYDPGHGVLNPNDINNVGFFVLFALIGLGFIVSSIWFFFWAKNGGFHFRKGDWSEYKSTVLRRKGPDGKTLSNATKSTQLGGGSVVGSEYTDTSYTSYQESEKSHDVEAQQTQKKKRRHKKANKYDADVREYRTEKAARVGGLNKPSDGNGTVHDWSTAASNLSSRPAMSDAPPPARQQSSKNPRRDFSFNHGSEASFSVVSSDVSSQAPLRPAAPQRYHGREEGHKRNSSSAANPKQYQSNRARRSQGFYADRAKEGGYQHPINFRDEERPRHDASSSTASEAQVQNTKSYKHTIPGLSKGPATTAVGFRRGGGQRRDSLSESGDDSYA